MAKKYRYGKATSCEQAIIFARVSTKEQEPNASLKAQKEAMEDYCAKKGLRIVSSYMAIESSTSGKRVVFHEMLDFVKKQKKKTAIVVHCVDRFQRRFNECVEVENMLTDDKTDIHFCKEGLILTKNSPSSDIMRWDMGILSGKMYVANLRDNVNRGMNYNWSIGKYQTKAPVGYLNVNKDIIIDEDRAPLVKKMFEMYATGRHSIKSLHKFAEEMHLCSSHTKTNKPLGRETIHAMLKNPFYYGEMVIRGEKMPHNSEPLIAKSLFDKVQEQLSGKAIHTQTPEYSSIPFAFRGLVKCANCGCTISSETHTKKSGRVYRYLRCAHSKGNCNQILVSEKVLLQQLNDEVFSKLKLTYSIVEPLKKCVQKKLLEEFEANAVMKRQITNELNQLNAREQRVKDSFFNGDITREEWQEEKAIIVAKREELQHTSEKYVEISKKIKTTINELLDIASLAYDVMSTANPTQQNKLLSLILSECYLDGQKLTYKLRPPFDKLVNLKTAIDWFDLNKSTIAEYENMTDKVERYKEDQE